MSGFGESMGNSLGDSTGDGTGRGVPPWKFGSGTAAMNGDRGNV